MPKEANTFWKSKWSILIHLMILSWLISEKTHKSTSKCSSLQLKLFTNMTTMTSPTQKWSHHPSFKFRYILMKIHLWLEISKVILLESLSLFQVLLHLLVRLPSELRKLFIPVEDVATTSQSKSHSASVEFKLLTSVTFVQRIQAQIMESTHMISTQT